MLCVTVFVAFAMLSLTNPSVVWLTLWPLAIGGVCVFLFVRVSPFNPELTFWIGLGIGVLAIIASSVFIYLTAVFANERGPEQDWEWLPHVAYAMLYGDNEQNPSIDSDRYSCFAASLQMIVAVVWSAIMTLLAQFLYRRRDNP